MLPVGITKLVLILPVRWVRLSHKLGGPKMGRVWKILATKDTGPAKQEAALSCG